MATIPPGDERPNPRWGLERAVLRSGLKAPARHLWLTLAVLADWPPGTTSEKHTPSLTELAKATGQSRSGIAQQLNILEDQGWIERLRPSVQAAWGDKEKTRYRLTSPAAALVQELDRSTTRTSPGAGLQLVQELDLTSPGAGHEPDLLQTFQKKEEKGPERISADFPITTPMRAWAAEHTPSLDLGLQTIQFVNYWTEAAENGRKEARKTPAGWRRAWQNWLAKAVEIQNGRTANGRPQTSAAARAGHQPYRNPTDNSGYNEAL